MSEMVKVAVDAMGGDNAPVEIVKGAIEAVNENSSVKICLVGAEDIIKEELKKYNYKKEQVEIVNATEVIETAEPPVMAIRKKKDSSIVKALQLVKSGECDAYVSAGSTGATLVGGQVIVGRLKGVERPPLAPLIPTEKGAALLIDCGANVDARPSHLVQFAKMGSVYMESVMKVKNPRVANVCEAFVGNVILKLYEGVGGTLIKKVKAGMMTSLRSKIGALLVKPALKETLKVFDLEQYGGAPLLGLKGLVVKTHGSSKAIEIKNSVLQCVTFKEQKINDKIKEKITLEDE